MKFQPIEVNGLTTFICQSQVSDSSVQQALDVFKVLNAKEGVIAGGIDKNKKNSLDLAIVPNWCLSLQKEIEEIKDKYIDYYSLDKFTPPLAITELFNLQKYPIGGAFHQIHCDRGYLPSNQYRELVWMTYLNDVSYGGETEFMYYRLKIQPKKGLTVIWPAGWTHIHRGLPSNTDEKYIATGWFSPKMS